MFKLTFSRLKELILFTLPLVIGQVGQMLFSIGDTFVAGRYSTEALSAIGVASAMVAPFVMVGVSTIFSVSSTAARLRGEGVNPHETPVWGSSLLLSFTLMVVLCGLLAIFTELVPMIGLNENIVANVQTYLRFVNVSLIPVYFFQIAKEYLQAFDKTIFANALIIFMNIVNLAMNYVLMFGIGPFPELGIKGAAIATIITRFIMAFVLMIYTYRVLPLEHHLKKESYFDLLKLGVPIGLGTLIEVLMFSTVTVLIGKMPVTVSAAHNIVLNIAGLTFMVPLAINGTAGVKVSYAFGKRDKELIRSYTLGCVFMTEAYMILMACVYFLIPEQLVALFTQDPQVIAYGAGLFFYVALFQIPDGLQITMWGVLRGLGMSKLPMIFSFCGYWLIAIPTGAYLAYKQGMLAAGLWAGLAIGLTIASLVLSYLYTYRMKQISMVLDYKES